MKSNLRGLRHEYHALTMASLQEKDQTFIVRLWLEPSESDDSVPQWRGVIENVQNGKRRYLKDLNELTAFIVPCLEKMGVTISSPQKKSRKWYIKWW
jgi:hypothetical protein